MGKRAVSAPDSVPVKLRRPLGTLSELTLKRPTAAEFRPLPMRAIRATEGRQTNATWGDLLSIVAGCSGVEAEILKGLSSADSGRLVATVNDFLASIDFEAARKTRTKKGSGGGITYTLERPLQVGTETIAKLELAPCSGAALWDLPLDPSIDDLLNLGSRLSLQPAPILDRLDFVDALPLIEVLSGFFEDSRGTGG